MSEPTTPDRDDEVLRAMLDARADRLPARAAADVVAAVHDEVRAPRAAAAFAVLPVMTKRGSMPAAGWAAAALVTVLVLAVLGGLPRSGPAATGTPSEPSPGSPSAVSPGSSPAPSPGLRSPASPGSPAPSSEPSTAPGASLVTPAGLRSGLVDGTLDGHLVLIDGQLKVVPMFCTLGSDCFGIAVAGFEDVPVSHDDQLTRPAAAAMHGELAFVVNEQTLAFVGRVVWDVGSPVSLASLMASEPAGAPDPFALTPVTGWLVVGGVHTCPMLGVGATPCPGPPPRLTDLRPTPDGLMSSGLQVPVAVDASVPGGQADTVVTPGPFLVRILRASGCAGMKTLDLTACLSNQPPTLRVLAHIASTSAVRVVTAPVTCSPAAVTAALTCEAAVADALKVVPAGASIVSIEFGGGACPPWVRCAALLPDDLTRGHVVIHLVAPGPDQWVPVTADSTGVITASAPIPFPAWWGTPSPAP